MPYVDISTGTDYASLWYITNSPTGTVGGFDPAKPTVIMLHPIFLDSTWLYAQFEDPRLDKSFNIIAFDARCAGRTISRPNGRHDHWTDAADIAFACHVSVPFVQSCPTSRCPRPLTLPAPGPVAATSPPLGQRVVRDQCCPPLRHHVCPTSAPHPFPS